MKKTLMCLLALIMAVSLNTTVFAEETGSTEIKCLEIKEEVTDYAKKVFPKHMNVLMETGDLSGIIEEYSIGKAFTVFNVEDNTHSSCFPILRNDNIVAILEVVEDQGEYNSSLSVSFAEELNNIFEHKELGSFVLLTDGVNLQAFDGEHSVEVFKLYDDGNDVGELISKFNFSISSLPNTFKQNDLKEDLMLGRISDNVGLRGIVRPRSYKTLGVAGVSQSGRTCWAATCAAIINYYKGSSLSDVDVATYVFGRNWNQGGAWKNIKKAYKHWGLYPSQTGVIGFRKVKENINGGDPMHLGLDGHSVGLIGYEDWVGSPRGGNERILILLEPNGGVHRSVTLNSSGNFYYKLGGGSNAWIYTREF